MVAYTFDPRFVEPIRQGYKRQTIRAPRALPGRHARRGELIQLYVGLRGPEAAKIVRDVRCTDVLELDMRFGPGGEIGRVWAGGCRVLDLDDFALRDGFRDADDMARFWREKHRALARFEGVLIEWAAPLEAMGVAA